MATTVKMQCDEMESVLKIRNTFIEMREKPQCSMRRCHSSPALDGDAEDKPKTGEHGSHAQNPQEEHGARSPTLWSDVSTDADANESGEDSSSTPETCDAFQKVETCDIACLQPTVEQNAFQKFHSDVHMLLAQVAVAVRQFAFCVGAEVWWDGNGYTLSAIISLEHLRFTERLATAAKTAIISLVPASKDVRLLGYMKVPFAPTQQGFVSTLASACDEVGQCKYMYKNGFCQRRRCRWEHPEFQTTLRFVMLVAGPSQLTCSVAQPESEDPLQT
jgi:hypothetical protein